MDAIVYALLNKKITEVELSSAAGLDFSFSATDGVLTLDLKNDEGTVIATQSVDLPTEMIVKTGYLDTNTNEIVLKNNVRVPISKQYKKSLNDEYVLYKRKQRTEDEIDR